MLSSAFANAQSPEDDHYKFKLILSVLVTQTAEIANSKDLDEVAHHEPPHLHMHCLPSSL